MDKLLNKIESLQKLKLETKNQLQEIEDLMLENQINPNNINSQYLLSRTDDLNNIYQLSPQNVVTYTSLGKYMIKVK